MKKRVRSFFFIVIIFIAAQTATAQTYYISTIAGKGIPGYNGDGIPAVVAELDNPIHTVTDKLGDVFIADGFNSRVRKVDANGIITTIAGKDTAGYSGDGGAATAAELDWPIALAFDDTGNLYIADVFENVIRKINTKGIITTFAGNDTSGYKGDGGPATAAEMGEPRGVALDDSGNVYIADQLSNCIRKVNTKGIISTVAGNDTLGYKGDGGPATNAEFNDPDQLAVDDSGNIYVDDGYNNVIRKINTKGIITTFAGSNTPGFSGDGGPATNAQLSDPLGIVTDKAGNVYITDLNSQRVRRVDVNGIITTIAGTGIAGHTGDGGPALSAELNGSIGINIDAFNNIYISEYYDGNNDIRELGSCPLSLTINPAIPAPICNGQSIELIAGGGGASYEWSPSEGLSATTGDIVTAGPSATVTYLVTESDTSGCSVSKYVEVTIKPSPPVIIQPPEATLCSGQSVTLTVMRSTINYNWNPGASLKVITPDSVIASPTITTIYRVTGTDSLGCIVSGSNTITVSPTPDKPTISQQGDIITSSATQGNQWVRNDSILQGATNQTYIVTIMGWYQVIAENPANGCSSTSDSEYINPSGINQLTVESEQLTVYPNPTSGEIIITSAKNIMEIKITNMLGQLLLTSYPQYLQTMQRLDLRELPGGMYFVTVTTDNETEIRKIILSK